MVLLSSVNLNAIDAGPRSGEHVLSIESSHMYGWTRELRFPPEQCNKGGHVSVRSIFSI
jgi:hypothetical protein